MLVPTVYFRLEVPKRTSKKRPKIPARLNPVVWDFRGIGDSGEH